MKTIDLSDENHAALLSQARERNLTVDELLGALLRKGYPPVAGVDVMPVLAGAEFLALTDPADRYLALLAWCARTHSRDFSDFVSHQESGHRYLMLSPDEVQGIRAHNHARQIDGTQFWAVMNIDVRSQRRFVRRLLEFIGCRDEEVAEVCIALGLASSGQPPEASPGLPG